MLFKNNQFFHSYKLRIVLFALILLCSFGSAFFKFKRRTAQKTPMEKCLEEMKSIPEIGAVLSNQEREDPEERRPLGGLEIALTFNEMVKSTSDPVEDLDNQCENENSISNLDKVSKALADNALPPTVAFIIGQAADKVTLERWLASGNLLGNMTYSRVKVRRHEPREFLDDVMENDRLLAPLLAKYHIKQKYFRYPKLKNTDDDEVSQHLHDFFSQQGYTETITMIETPDWQVSDLYCAAQARGDETCVNLVKQSFKTLLLNTTLKTRKAARNKAGRDAKLILTLGMNQFTCDFLGELILWYKDLGAKFIALDEALADPIYKDVDDRGRPIFQTILRRAHRAQPPEISTQ